MALLPLEPRRAGVVLRGVAVLGLVAAVLGAVAGWLLLDRTGDALAASLSLTEEALTSLDASAGVATEAVDGLATSLASLETTAEDLDVAFDDGEALMGELAGVVRSDIAEAIGAVSGALPAVVQTADVVDG